MREIKFKAWLKNEKKMVDVLYIDFDARIIVFYNQDEEYEDVIREEFAPFDAINLIQYIGLKDKNGVEIYEGDIVDDFGTRCTVIWEQFDCSFQLSCTRYQCSLGEYDTNTIEVIGNIYENPELLEK